MDGEEAQVKVATFIHLDPYTKRQVERTDGLDLDRDDMLRASMFVQGEAEACDSLGGQAALACIAIRMGEIANEL